ncbi:MAG: 2-oxoglutarate dehydrogenase complex dihydrolipoyllysine-residue succinyltransferase [Bdellovibrionales bacterium]|nr:2-oxoglutarate dehydrogenase complex dihydrolipoyllysine-residue succinyltransferase [Bdellovibrionales bacterium]
MKQKVVAPSVGESITEVRILKWTKPNGSAVKAGDILLEIETDKATVEVAAENSGALLIVKQEGETVPVGEILGYVDDAAAGTASAETPKATAPAAAAKASSPASAASGGAYDSMGPAARKMAAETGIDANRVAGTGKDGRVTKGDLMAAAGGAGAAPLAAAPKPAQPKAADRPGDRRVPMTRIRQRIAERLVEAQHTAAILTTFNEVDMTAVMKVRNAHKDSFKAKHGVPLSFMSFFTRACVLALQAQPAVNASIDGTDTVFHDYCDVGIAVGTERGLVVPVLRNAQQKTFVEIERDLADVATKARSGKLSIAEMSGGTFTISNGGVYGSLLSTPILNLPQSAILGMHKIQERPIVVEGKIEVRPMMYLALSYDHRIIDGKEAVTFLIAVRDALENPEKLGMEFIGG